MTKSAVQHPFGLLQEIDEDIFRLIFMKYIGRFSRKKCFPPRTSMSNAWPSYLSNLSLSLNFCIKSHFRYVNVHTFNTYVDTLHMHCISLYAQLKCRKTFRYNQIYVLSTILPFVCGARKALPFKIPLQGKFSQIFIKCSCFELFGDVDPESVIG